MADLPTEQLNVRHRISFFEQKKTDEIGEVKQLKVKKAHSMRIRAVVQANSPGDLDAILASVSSQQSEILQAIDYTKNDHIRFQNRLIELLIQIIEISPLIGEKQKSKLLESVREINGNLSRQLENTKAEKVDDGDDFQPKVGKLKSLFENMSQQNDGLNHFKAKRGDSGLGRSKSMHVIPSWKYTAYAEASKANREAVVLLPEKQSVHRDDSEISRDLDEEFDQLMEKYDIQSSGEEN